MLQRVCMEENVKGILAEIFDTFSIEMTTSMPCCLFYCPLAFQRHPKLFKRVIAFRVSSPKKEYKVISVHNK